MDAPPLSYDPLTTLKNIQDHLSELHMLGFLSRRDNNQGVSGGQYYEYELDMGPEIIIRTRTEIETNEV
ncbi:cell division control protein 6-like protein [Halogranum salarium B-1]|uniref:Cell division control protein 6-like protein n=1 Tax=Halogranum salarium B-1 TaxID=1210908 RepID=J2Z8E0_9EURY|nr:cell division control protein Cdc6 [Halogranum salarium]EJN56875.1 cell division control protein 6-like protein [Halogranum salarium B-1]